jgi:hypothetical protein
MKAVGVDFPTRGFRRRVGYGISYVSRCGRYELYKSDQVDCLPVKPVRWIAIALAAPVAGGGVVRKVLSRHKRRPPAAAACIKHARKSVSR